MEVKYPPWLIPLSLLFWGLLTDAFPATGLLMALIWLSRHTPWRWRLKRSQYHRIGDLSSILILGVAFYFGGSSGPVHPVYQLLRWLPALFAPLLLAQMYGMDGHLPMSVLFYSLRRRENAGTLDFRLPYALLTVVAAGSRPSTEGLYQGGAMLLVLWTLWCNRPRIQAAPVWLLGFAVAVGLGYEGQLGLARLQALVEELAMDWISGMNLDIDPFRTHTSVGDLGKLKLSGRIVLRIESDVHLLAPLLLKEAAYDRYQGRQWLASKAHFSPYPIPHEPGPRHIRISPAEVKRDLLLSLPEGVKHLELLPPKGRLVGNRLGAVEWQDTPPVLHYRVGFDSESRNSSPPTQMDLEVLGDTKSMLTLLVDRLGLRMISPQRTIAVIADFFARDFRYSLFLGNQTNSISAFEEFLYSRHSGHCEYFATATTLLLRTAGVPARYVVGYVVDEYSESEGLYVVRARHAHAWTEAYVDGVWRSIDNTPGTWADAEAENDPWWQTAADVWSRWLSVWRTWRWEQSQRPERQGFPLWGWLVLPLLLWLAWRLYRSRQRVFPPPKSLVEDGKAEVLPDPDWRELERAMEKFGHSPRAAGETPLRWLRRIGREEYEGEAIAYYGRRYGSS